RDLRRQGRLVVLGPGGLDVAQQLLRPVTQVEQAVIAVQPAGLVGQGLGLVVLALVVQLARFGQRLDRVFLVALGVRLVNVLHQLVGRVLEQAPFDGAAVGLVSQRLGLFQLALGVQSAGLVEQGTAIDKRLGRRLRLLGRLLARLGLDDDAAVSALGL